MSGFNPQKIRVIDYPHPVGTIMRGSMGSTSTVVDRGGFAFLACCITHDEQGVASGYYVQAEDGRILDRSEPTDLDTYVCPHTPGQLFA
ncbi:hypothetical protein [Streptomyces sp. NPDC088775]|uniref:hypothetical protein n=1 Tax=Streptomyces sp. NPDC088775 TaxID=3365896 RepID=UPI0038122281